MVLSRPLWCASPAAVRNALVHAFHGVKRVEVYDIHMTTPPHLLLGDSLARAAVQAALGREAEQHGRRGRAGCQRGAQHAQRLVQRQRRPAAEDAPDQLTLV